MKRQHILASYDPMLALQASVPRSSLASPEALTIAEVQATVLLKMIAIRKPPVPVPKLARYLGISIEQDPSAGAVGYHVLREDTWTIGYGDLTAIARDATIAHHIKLILDEPFGDPLYPYRLDANAGPHAPRGRVLCDLPDASWALA